MSNPVVHFEVSGKNGKVLQKFYGKLFGWKMNSWGPDYAMVKKGRKDGIAGGIAKGKPYVTFYVSVRSLDKALAAAKKLGGKVVAKPMEVPGAGIKIAMFKDPAGNTIGLVK